MEIGIIGLGRTGSVNSNRSHFESALKDISAINTKFGGILEEMITNRFKLKDYESIFGATDGKRIKTVIEVEPWK